MGRKYMCRSESKCKSCRFSAMVDVGEDGEMMSACLYILKTKKRRPCPAGNQCTVYAPRSKKTESVARHSWADSGLYT